MIPIQSFLFRAIYDWMAANQWSIFLLVQSEEENQDKEKITLVYNISPNAIRDLAINQQEISFCASFNSKVQHMKIDLYHVVAIHTLKNNEMFFYFKNNDIVIPLQKLSPNNKNGFFIAS